jgi:hypothetical protein
VGNEGQLEGTLRHQGNGCNLSFTFNMIRQRGQQGSEEKHTFRSVNLPNHSHIHFTYHLHSLQKFSDTHTNVYMFDLCR